MSNSVSFSKGIFLPVLPNGLIYIINTDYHVTNGWQVM